MLERIKTKKMSVTLPMLALVGLLGKTTATTAGTVVGTHEVLETATASSPTTAPLYTCHCDDDNGQCYGEAS